MHGETCNRVRAANETSLFGIRITESDIKIHRFYRGSESFVGTKQLLANTGARAFGADDQGAGLMSAVRKDRNDAPVVGAVDTLECVAILILPQLQSSIGEAMETLLSL